jgi:hypothetical protein
MKTLPPAYDLQGGLTPAAVVERLDKVIIGQEDAKKAVAIAFRNRCDCASVTSSPGRRPWAICAQNRPKQPVGHKENNARSSSHLCSLDSQVSEAML